jgi:hypothetical protein
MKRDWRAQPRTTFDPAIVHARPLFTARPEMVRRRDALVKLQAKYRGKSFDWKKRRTCAHLLRSHLVQMGHRPPSMPYFTSPIGAVRALREHGWSNVIEMLDALLPRIAPAAMLGGDIAAFPSEDGLGAIFVAAGGGKYLGWREDQPALVVLDVPPRDLAGAWRA